MFLFILESIGTSELALIGIVALIVLGPRRLPEMARKIGKLMAEFRGTANEFKETWQKEVDFEAEKKALDLKDLTTDPVPREDATGKAAPMIKSVDPASFHSAVPTETPAEAEPPTAVDVPTARPADAANDKRNWL